MVASGVWAGALELEWAYSRTDIHGKRFEDELERIGYSIAIYPATGFLAMGAALKQVYQQILATGSSIDAAVELEDFQFFSKLMGFQDVWDFEKKWADEG